MRLVALVIFLLVMGAVPARGYMLLPPRESVGAITVRAERIVIGRITQIDRLGGPYSRVTVAVEETILGAKEETLTFSSDALDDGDLAALGRPMLICLRSNAPHDTLLLDLSPNCALYALWPNKRWRTIWQARNLFDDFDQPLYLHEEVVAEIRKLVPVRGATKLATIDGSYALSNDPTKATIAAKWEAAALKKLHEGEGKWNRVEPSVFPAKITIAVTKEVQAAALARLRAGVDEWNAAEILIQDPTPEHLEALRQFAWRLPAEPAPPQNVSRYLLLLELRARGVSNLPPLIPSAGVGHTVLLFGMIGALPAMYVLWRRRQSRFWRVSWCVVMGLCATLWCRSYWCLDALSVWDFDVYFGKGDIVVREHTRVTDGHARPLRYHHFDDLRKIEEARITSPANIWNVSPTLQNFEPPYGLLMHLDTVDNDLAQRKISTRRFLVQKQASIRPWQHFVLFVPLWLPTVLLLFFPGWWVFMAWFRRHRQRQEVRFEVLPPKG